MNINLKEFKKIISNLINTISKNNVSTENDSLERLFELTEPWSMSSADRLNKNHFKYSEYLLDIMNTLNKLGLQKDILSSHSHYQIAVILGSTGPSHYKLWCDLIWAIMNKDITVDRIILLGGDRQIHPVYDSMQSVYLRHRNDFINQLTDKEICSCMNEMELMEKISHSLKLPEEINVIDRLSVFTARNKENKIQTNTEETLIHLKHTYTLQNDIPILLLGTLPHLLRQWLQAKRVLKNYKIDMFSRYKPFYETIDSSYKGKLPAILYLDELHWLISTMLINRRLHL